MKSTETVINSLVVLYAYKLDAKEHISSAKQQNSNLQLSCFFSRLLLVKKWQTQEFTNPNKGSERLNPDHQKGIQQLEKERSNTWSHCHRVHEATL